MKEGEGYGIYIGIGRRGIPMNRVGIIYYFNRWWDIQRRDTPTGAMGRRRTSVLTGPMVKNSQVGMWWE